MRIFIAVIFAFFAIGFASANATLPVPCSSPIERGAEPENIKFIGIVEVKSVEVKNDPAPEIKRSDFKSDEEYKNKVAAVNVEKALGYYGEYEAYRLKPVKTMYGKIEGALEVERRKSPDGDYDKKVEQGGLYQIIVRDNNFWQPENACFQKEVEGYFSRFTEEELALPPEYRGREVK